MIFWLDAQLPPALAKFLFNKFATDIYPLREIGLRDAEDREIFQKARKVGAILVTKDSDFIEMVDRLGTPPQILWVTCGNVSNEYLRKVFLAAWPDVIALLEEGEAVVELADEKL